MITLCTLCRLRLYQYTHLNSHFWLIRIILSNLQFCNTFILIQNMLFVHINDYIVANDGKNVWTPNIKLITFSQGQHFLPLCNSLTDQGSFPWHLPRTIKPSFCLASPWKLYHIILVSFCHDKYRIKQKQINDTQP